MTININPKHQNSSRSYDLLQPELQFQNDWIIIRIRIIIIIKVIILIVIVIITITENLSRAAKSSSVERSLLNKMIFKSR